MREPDYSDDDIETRQQLLGEEWWTSAFLSLIRPGHDSAELAKGRRLSERGQVIIRGIHPGGVEAVVLGAVGGSHRVSLWFDDLGNDWEVLYRLFSVRQDLFSRLLAGDFSNELNDLFLEAGISIIPASMMDLDYRCDCESTHHTCSHIIATYLSLGKHVNEDPMILFLLRGKTREEIMSGVADIATIQSEETIETEKLRDSAYPDPPVSPGNFFEPGPQFDAIRYRNGYQPGKETEYIRLLGHSPFRVGKTDLSDLIAESYPKASRFLVTLLPCDPGEKVEPHPTGVKDGEGTGD